MYSQIAGLGSWKQSCYLKASHSVEIGILWSLHSHKRWIRVQVISEVCLGVTDLVHGLKVGPANYKNEKVFLS